MVRVDGGRFVVSAILNPSFTTRCAIPKGGKADNLLAPCKPYSIVPRKAAWVPILE